MSIESIFRIAFWFLFGGLIIMQVYFASRVRQAGERVAADRNAIAREGWGYVVARIIWYDQYLTRQRVSNSVRSPMPYFWVISELCAATHCQRPARLTQVCVHRC